MAFPFFGIEYHTLVVRVTKPNSPQVYYNKETVNAFDN